MNTRQLLVVGSSGYVGSRLVHAFRKAGVARVAGCDVRSPVDGSAGPDVFYQQDCRSLPDAALQDASAVFWFAGHSSVAMARDDVRGTIHNNVTGLLELLERAHAVGVPVVYASSASVLSSREQEFSSVASEARANIYDASKLALDLLAPYVHPLSLGLRMGTVSGWSPRMRWELVFNAMCRDAHLHRLVRVQNPGAYRGLLFLDDLCRYLLNWWQCIGAGQSTATGTVALASWAGTIGGLATEIAHCLGAELHDGRDTQGYSFVAPVCGVQGFAGEQVAAPVWPQALAVQCRRFLETSLKEGTL